MAKLITKCPSCGEKKLKVTRIECGQCSTKFEGEFEIPKLLQLEADDLEFIQTFVKCSGSLKEMSKIFDVSYPTMRNRLNAIIEQLEKLTSDVVSKRDEVISALERGELTARQAAELLSKL